MSLNKECKFEIGQRVHSVADSRRVGTVMYVGPVDGYSGTWVGVDWDNGDGKHDGSIKGVRYFRTSGERSGSFVRPHTISKGVPFLEALASRYTGETTKEEEGKWGSPILFRFVFFYGCENGIFRHRIVFLTK